MQVVERLSAAQLLLRSPPHLSRCAAWIHISSLESRSCFRRAHWFCVSHLSECSMVVRFRLFDAPPHAHSLYHSLLKPKRADSDGKLANHQDWLIRIQIP